MNEILTLFKEYTPEISKTIKNFFDELIKNGFTEEQAMKLITSESMFKFN